MTQLHGLWIILEQVQQCLQPVHGFRRMPEARGKLKQNATELVRLNQRQYALFELFNFDSRPFVFVVSELLPGLDRELEISRRALRPTFRSRCGARPIKSGIDLDRVKVSRIELEFVRFRQRIEHTGPRAWPSIRRITPTTRSDTPYPCIILRLDEEIACYWITAFLSRHCVCRICGRQRPG